MSAAPLCSMSDWSGQESRTSSPPKTSQSAPQTRYGIEEDDPLWPPIVRENISAVATSVQTPFNDAATGGLQKLKLGLIEVRMETFTLYYDRDTSRGI